MSHFKLFIDKMIYSTIFIWIQLIENITSYQRSSNPFEFPQLPNSVRGRRLHKSQFVVFIYSCPKPCALNVSTSPHKSSEETSTKIAASVVYMRLSFGAQTLVVYIFIYTSSSIAICVKMLSLFGSLSVCVSVNKPS